MGRSPHTGEFPVFRFSPIEISEMETTLRNVDNAMPSRNIIRSLALKFSTAAERAGMPSIQSKQVFNWFQNKRHSQRVKMTKASSFKLTAPPIHQEDPIPYRNLIKSFSIPPGKSSSNSSHMEFEAKSARDGAWYDVTTFISHRMFETGEPEVQVRFTGGFGNDEEDEWINICKCVRLRSIPCEPSECVAVLPGDLILCFQEVKDQALYFDAHIIDAQRRKHDIRGCRCKFLVRYDHDQSEEIVPLKKICRRPETDCRLQILQASNSLCSMDMGTLASIDAPFISMPDDLNDTELKPRKAQTAVDVRTDEFMMATNVLEVPSKDGPENENASVQSFSHSSSKWCK